MLPEVPTIAEAGIPGYDATIWIGVMAPAGTPRPIVDAAQPRDQQDPVTPGHQGGWQRQGAIPMMMTPEEFGAYIDSEIVRWGALIKANGIHIN